MTYPAEASATLPISVVIATKNNVSSLANTLEHLRDFDDVTVVDSASTDGTIEIALEHGARVVQFEWNGKYPKKKQWSISQAGAKHPWVLILDADEYPEPALVAELKALVPELQMQTFAAYDITLKYRFAGKFLSHGHKVVKRSLLDPQRAAFPEVDDLWNPGTFEIEGHYQPQTEGKIGRVKGNICHDDRDPVTSWFRRHNNYSDWEAHLRTQPAAREELASKRTQQGQLWDKVPFKPLVFFVYSYIARGGFLDGRAGFDYALGLSMYYWQIGVKVREIKRNQSETAR